MSEPTVMGRPRSEPPTTWDTWRDGSERSAILDLGSDIYVHVGDGTEVGLRASKVLVWHWHTPTEGAHRWSASMCGLHEVVSVDPLELSPSLACENGCPSHGYIRAGRWVSC